MATHKDEMFAYYIAGALRYGDNRITSNRANIERTFEQLYRQIQLTETKKVPTQQSKFENKPKIRAIMK